MSEWQPIETAPKTGEPVIGYFPERTGFQFSVIFWMNFGNEHDCWYFNGTWRHEPGEPMPTHWMVPDPPRPDQAEGNNEGG